MSLLQDGAYWRERAEEVLAIADRIADHESKWELIAIAEKYVVLAYRADARASGHPLSRAP